MVLFNRFNLDSFPGSTCATCYFCNNNASQKRAFFKKTRREITFLSLFISPFSLLATPTILSLASFPFRNIRARVSFLFSKNPLLFQKKTPSFSTRRFRASLIYYLASVCVPFFAAFADSWLNRFFRGLSRSKTFGRPFVPPLRFPTSLGAAVLAAALAPTFDVATFSSSRDCTNV